jgi:hypothetical protein
MFNIIVGAGALGAGAGAASRYGSGSDQKMQLFAAPAPQHWLEHNVDNQCVKFSGKNMKT